MNWFCQLNNELINICLVRSSTENYSPAEKDPDKECHPPPVRHYIMTCMRDEPGANIQPEGFLDGYPILDIKRHKNGVGKNPSEDSYRLGISSGEQKVRFFIKGMGESDAGRINLRVRIGTLLGRPAARPTPALEESWYSWSRNDRPMTFE